MQRHFRLGGVASETTRLRGQGLIEYVLIAAVIGLVVIFAGPQVSGAIRNQFNLVGNTVSSGTTGGTESGGASGGGSTGTASATVQAAVAKDAKDWTLDEQKAVAEDIAVKGEASSVYTKAKAAMDAGTTWSVKLTNGETMTYRIIGINHDDLADGSGKAGLTFEATNGALGQRWMNSDILQTGGWRDADLRSDLNSYYMWKELPNELKDCMETVAKLTYNPDDLTSYDPDGGVYGSPSATYDKVFLLSSTELWGDTGSDGTQYEFYASKGVSTSSYDGASSECRHWTRSVSPYSSKTFQYAASSGKPSAERSSSEVYVFPAWCF